MMNLCAFSVYRVNQQCLPRVLVRLALALFVFTGHWMLTGSDLWAQQGAQQARGSEPIFAVLQDDLAFDRSTASASGEILANQILCVRLKDSDVYQGFELELREKDQATDEKTGETQNAHMSTMNLLLYTQLHKSKQSGGPPYRGIRLVTHTLAGSALLRFALGSVFEEQNAKPFLGSESALIIEREAFPLCMALYSFGKMQTMPAQAAGYLYTLRFVPKNFGFVQFRLLLPNRAMNHNLNDELTDFRLQIDRQEYQLEGNEQSVESQVGSTLPKNGIFYSRRYQLALGEHEVQINDEKTYASAQFSIKPGQTKVVDLLLQERMSQLRIVLPQGASLLVDGIPLRSGQTAPVWQNVEIQKLQGYQYALPRFEYRLKLPAGKHHLLLQYEGRTWERKLYFAEGEEQYFELNWQLGSLNQAAQ